MSINLYHLHKDMHVKIASILDLSTYIKLSKVSRFWNLFCKDETTLKHWSAYHCVYSFDAVLLHYCISEMKKILIKHKQNLLNQKLTFIIHPMTSLTFTYDFLSKGRRQFSFNGLTHLSTSTITTVKQYSLGWVALSIIGQASADFPLTLLEELPKLLSQTPISPRPVRK